MQIFFILQFAPFGRGRVVSLFKQLIKSEGTYNRPYRSVFCGKRSDEAFRGKNCKDEKP